MAHFAKVNNNIVERIIVAEQDFIDNMVDTSPGTWIQTSYNTYGGVHYDPETKLPSDDQSKALRYNYACVGGNYDSQDDAFYMPQPYPSWTLNTDTYLWESPVDRPESGGIWNEDTQSWDALESE